MREFTPKEIELCKKIAERERREIKKGDWVIDINRADIPLLVIDIQLEYLTLSLGYEATYQVSSERKKGSIPLWQIHDCLEWLKEKGWFRVNINTVEADVKCTNVWKNIAPIETSGKTPLEALLSAVLAIQEEK